MNSESPRLEDAELAPLAGTSELVITGRETLFLVLLVIAGRARRCLVGRMELPLCACDVLTSQDGDSSEVSVSTDAFYAANPQLGRPEHRGGSGALAPVSPCGCRWFRWM